MIIQPRIFHIHTPQEITLKCKNFLLLMILFLALPMSSLAAVVSAVKGAPLAVAFVNSSSADDSNSYYAKKIGAKGHFIDILYMH